jgi:hypothetical protein
VPTLRHLTKSTQRPKDPAQAVDMLYREVEMLNDRFSLLEYSLQRTQYAAPDKPREGQFAKADGVTWNPGGGAGLYQYQGGAWVKL